ncbi:MAG: SusD/RagB family nutrient-binding outer membrane lipoprotein [Cyclobacteriaceae bacterium]
MNNIYKKIGIFFLLLVTACDLDGDLENPNQVSVGGADVDLIMNNLQLNFADFYHSAAGTVDPLVRMQAMTAGYRYQTAFSPSSLDDTWDLAYRNVLISNQIMQPLAVEKGLTTHVAVGKILEAYTYLTLVDVFGDVPQTEALKGASGNFNPTVSSGSDIYTYAIQLLTEARTELAKTGSDAGGALVRDIFYDGSRAKWNALSNSLELKAWINISMIPSRAAEANTKIAGFVNLTTGAAVANLVDTEAENFRYKYGTATVPAGSRHPWYEQYYGATPGTAGGYLNNYYLHEVFGKWDPTDPTNPDKVVQDPRWRNYFYRQIGSTVVAEAKFDPKAIFCGAPPPHYATWGGGVFCTFQPGFFGRDHGDGSGTPPDGAAMTCAGAYPAGGKIDSNPITNNTYNVPAKRGDGANGAGIQPIFMSWFTDFTRAELMARAGQPAIAKTILATAIDNSITQVRNFVTAGGQTLSAGVLPSTANYQAAVSTLYDAASVKMDVIGKEYWIALFGNGIEAYNMYRRTSAPRNLQPTVQVSSDPYFRSMVYPAIYANLNSSATQKDAGATNKVFWDNNPDNLN